MTIDDLIQLLRANRAGAHRARVTDTIHGIERFSLGTEVDTGGMSDAQLMGGGFKFELTDGKLVLKK